MARDVDVHPSDKVIQAYGQGRLSAADAARFEKHLAGCATCSEKLGGVDGDTFSDLLRNSSSDSATSIVDDVPFPEIPPELQKHGRYEIQRRLGSGGMGVVYQAMHRIMRRPVALKMIRPDLVATPLAVSRFRREVEAAARLTHPNIVTAFDAENVSGVHFLVMEYVDGVSLEEFVQKNGPLPAAKACELACQAARGLAHAHSFGMVHRDVKPGNLMVTESGTVKILDFGLAAWSTADAATSVTHFGARLGTPAFAAPEQFPATDRVDARADQYGLGATLFYVLTGKPPGSKLSLPADLPPPVRAVVKRLMAVAPEKRFASMDAAVTALEGCCGETKPAPTNRRGKSRRFVGVAVALGLLAIVAGLAAWTFRNRNETPAAAPALPVLFLLPSRGLWHEDYFPARKALEAGGRKVLVATPGGAPSTLHDWSMKKESSRPTDVRADLKLSDVQPHQFDAIVCVGAEDVEFTNGKTPSSRDAMRLLRDAAASEKWIVGICKGQLVVGAAGLLQGKKTAHATQYVSDPASMGAIPQEESVVVDGRIITASAPPDAARAATTLIENLKKR